MSWWLHCSSEVNLKCSESKAYFLIKTYRFFSWTRMWRERGWSAASCATVVKGASARSSRHRSRAAARVSGLVSDRQVSERGMWGMRSRTDSGAAPCAGGRARTRQLWTSVLRLWSKRFRLDLHNDLALRNICTRLVCEFTGKILTVHILAVNDCPAVYDGMSDLWSVLRSRTEVLFEQFIRWRYNVSDRTRTE